MEVRLRARVTLSCKGKCSLGPISVLILLLFSPSSSLSYNYSFSVKSRFKENIQRPHMERAVIRNNFRALVWNYKRYKYKKVEFLRCSYSGIILRHEWQLKFKAFKVQDGSRSQEFLHAWTYANQRLRTSANNVHSGLIKLSDGVI